MTPDPAPTHEITSLLAAAREGAPDAMERLMARVYDDLCRIAHRQLGAEEAGHTLDTTALVHEAYLRLADQRDVRCVDRSHFFAIAARMMRRVLMDYARRHKAARRGGGELPVAIDMQDFTTDGGASPLPLDASADARADELLALDEALARLEQEDARRARVVELRYFAGLTEVEVAKVLGVTERTVRRDWTAAREWLYREVTRELG
jgi:RNA polymerase sigma factor (TIGR02999 family)